LAVATTVSAAHTVAVVVVKAAAAVVATKPYPQPASF
jgi:hypothetical protein